MFAKRICILGIAILLSAVVCSSVYSAGTVGTKRRYDKATTLIQEGRYDRAIGELNIAIEYAPANAQYHFTRADVYLRLNRPDMAIADYTSIIYYDPNNLQAYQKRAALYFSAKNYDKCWDDVHKAADLGFTFDQQFIQNLKTASGREK
jgi:tetratricopeptide (TPR) repeat protein